MFVSCATLLGFFLPPEIQTPSPMLPDESFSLTYEIVNSNILPLLEVNYRCVLDEVVYRDGTTFERVDSSGRQWKPRDILWGRQKMTAECQNVLTGGPHIASAKIALAVSFWAPPVPWKRTVTQNYRAIVEPKTFKFLRWIAE